jgi:uncharacterized repeat protein (TIGR01451 family)
MSYYLGSWLRGMKLWLPRQRPGSTGPAARPKETRPRRGLWLRIDTLESRIAPVSGLISFAPGANIIDMGQPTQTVGNALKPYGLVYDLVTNFKVPVDWAINPAKTTYRLNPGDPIPVDFTATITTGTKNYSGGSFIIDPGFLTPAVIADINSWKAQGVVVDTLAAPLTTDIYGQITSFPRAVLDSANGNLAVPYYTNAGVPASSYVVGNPTNLTVCNDIYILPHADPDRWPVLWQQDLYNFIVNDGGALWVGCHAGSVLSNTILPDGTQLNFLSNGGLVPFGSHSNGTPPYTYNPAAASDPIMQIMNNLDAATQNGSEQIYVPTSAGWRSTTTVAIYDPDHPNNPAGGTAPFNKAAVVAFGNAYGNPADGMVMYEGGHSLAGTAAANIAAQRAFFNYLLTVGIARAPQATVTVPTIQAGRPVTLTATITGGDGNYNYQWVSTNGGVFSAPAGTATAGQTITTQYLLTQPTDTVRLVITDTPCGRQGIASVNVAIPPPVIDLDANDSSGATGADFQGTFSGNGAVVPAADTDTTVTDAGSPTISSAVIKLTNRPDGTAETLLIDTALAASFGISVQSDGNGGFILTGTASTAAYAAVIATLQYTNSLAFPNTQQRVITVQVNDGINNSNVATSRLNYAGGSPVTVDKELYLNQPGQGMNRVDPVAAGQTITSTAPMNPVVSPNSTGMGLWTNKQTQNLVFSRWNLTSFGTPAVQTADGGSYTYMTSAASETRNEAIQIGVTSDQHVSGAVWNGTAWTPIAINVGGKVTQNLGKPGAKQYAGAAVAYMEANGNAMLVWNTGKVLDYSIWNGTSWTPAVTVTAYTGAEPRQIQIAANPLDGSNELVMTVTDTGHVSWALVWNGSSWGNLIQLGTTSQQFTDTNVAYEQQDGRALVTYASGTAGLVGYRIWNGTTWSAAATVSPPSGASGLAQWTVLASDPHSNSIVLGVQTAGHSAWMDVWNGTSWGTATIGTTNGVANQSNLNIAVAYEDKSGIPLVVYETASGATQLQFRTFSGGVWSAATSFFTDTKTPRAIILSSNPYSDQIMMMVNDDGQVLQADLWSGTAFGGQIQLQPYTGSTSGTNTTQGQPMSFFWDSFLPGTVTTQTTFTQTTPMTSAFVMPVGGAVTVTTYIQITSGTLPTTPDLSVTLSYQAGTGQTVGNILTILGPPTVTSLGGGLYRLVWTGTVQNNLTIPTGDEISLTYTDFDTGYSFNILYGSETDPSQVQVATATAITVDSVAVFNAPFPCGSPVTATPAGQPAFVRFTVSDPFGASDITSADLVIKNSSGGTVLSMTLTDANVVASTAGSKTYEFAWTPPTGDTFSITVTAHEGTEGVTATGQTTITATAAPDLVVTKSDGGVTVNPGGTVAYTIDFSNAGLALSTGVVLTEFLPVGSTFNAAASTPGWTALGTTAFTFAVGSLTPGGSGSVVFAVNVPSPVPAGLRTLNNTVNIADDGTHGADTNPDNNSASDSTPINAGPDLVVTKTDGGVSTLPGGIVLYQITYSNIGTADDVGVTLDENLPANTTFNSTYSDSRWNSEGPGVFSITIGDLPVGASGTAVFAVTVDSPLPPDVTEITNTVSISDSGASGPDLNPDNNTATDTTPIAIQPEADLQITKTDNLTTVTPGQVVTYTITVTNAGPNVVTGAAFTDNVPSSLSGVTYTSVVSGGATATPGSGTGNDISASLDLPVGGTVVYTVTGTLDPNATAGALTNIATVFPPAGIVDPNTGNNTAVDQNTIEPVSDLAMNKSFTFTDLDGSGTITPGDEIVFALTVTNLGPNAAQNVSVLDLLPNGYQFVSDDARLNGGTYQAGTGLWTIGTIGATAPNNTAVLHITAIVGPGGNYTNVATINTSDSFDPNPGNNSSTVTPPVEPKSDLTLSKTLALTHDINGTGVISIGDQVTFTLTLNNLGPNDAANVQVVDLLPAGYAFFSAAPSQGTYTSATGVWNVGTVPVLSTQTLRIVATVVGNHPASAYTNSAQASSSNFDPTPENNHASVRPFIADLSVTKAAGLLSDNDGSGTLTVGDTVRFTVTVTNAGPDFATGVHLVDLLTAGFTYVSDDSGGTYDPTTGLWNVGAIAPGTTLTLTITADVNPSGPYTNTAQVTASDQFDPNSTPNNNVPTEDDQATVTLTPGATLTDLAVAKTVNNATPNVGNTFTVTLTNNGPATATGVTLQDILPTGLTFVSATTSPGTTYNSSTGVWTVGTVTTTTPQILTIQALVVSPNPLTNTAALSHLDQFDSDSSNISASVTVTPQRADLALTKTVSDATPNVGDTVTFTVTLSNLGPDAATNVSVGDALPVGLTLVSAVPSQGTVAGGVWAVGTVNPGPFQTQTLTITATVTGHNPATNTASVSHSDQFDPNLANNSADATVTPQQADLAVFKTVSDATPNVGDTVTFTVALINLGPNTATGVTVQDLLPADLTFVSDTTSQGTYSNITGVWAVGTVNSGSPQTLTITAIVTSHNPATNTATISHSDQFDPNDTNNTASATVTPPQADLGLTKTVSNARPNVGDTITFTVTLTNAGPDDATNVSVSDDLPAGLTLVSATPSQGTYAGGVWDVGTVIPGAPLTLTLTATVVSSSVETNTASISHSDQFDPNDANNTAGATVTPQRADLALAKSVSDATPNVGDTITFTITLSNAGPDAATGVTVDDLLPAGLTFVSATPSVGTYSSTTGVWAVGNVTTAAPQTLLIQATVDSPEAQTNTATISHSDQFDPDPGNNQTNVTVTPQQADLALAKTFSDATPNVGDTITFTVTLTNAGPDAATNAQVTDLLPTGLGFVSASTSQGTYSSSTGLWTVGTVAYGAVATLQIQATVNSPTTQTNRATISHADQFDPDTGNNTAGASTTPQQADLAVGKTVSNPTPNVGDTITYTIRVTNNGPDAASGVTVQDVLPAQVSFQSASATAGSYDPATRSWAIGSVPNGTTQTLTIVALVVSPNPVANTAAISHSDQFDPNPANNSDTASIVPQQADLQLGKVVSDATPNVGDTITFTVTLTNNGFSAATNVTVQDLLPAGLTFVSATPSQGAYNSTTGAWAVGTVTTTTPETLLLQATVVSAAAQTNSATITHSDQFDPDPGNNSASITVTPQQADLAVTKVVDNATPNVGDTITFTVALTNRGPDTATGVTVRDLLPAGLTFDSATPSQGTYDSATGVWTVGTVTTTAARTLLIQATVTGPSPQTNSATISAADQFDPDTGNNSDNITVTPQQADLALSKTVSDATPNVGDTITFTVTLTNHGPDPATNVTVEDLLPAGLALVSATESQGAYDGATGRWTVGEVGPSVPATLTLQATVLSPSAQTNTATISHSDQFDPVPGNNTASVTATPQQADLLVTKTVSNPTPNVGDTITYTITLTNAGPDPATGVTVQDTLPSDVAFVSATPSQGTYDPATGVWTVGTVAVGVAQAQTLTITATVINDDPGTNTATISAADQFDPNPANNTATASTNPQHADLALAKTVSDPRPNVGDTITFTITLSNSGPNTATAVTVEDLLPPGLLFVSATPSEGTYDRTTGAWAVGTVTTTTPETLTLTATVDSPTAQTNTATIRHSDQFDPNPGNNTAGATTTPQRADLALSKTVSNPTPNVGDTITYTITLTNSGPDPATSVTVADTLQPGVSFVSATPSQGTYDNLSGVWTVGTVNPGTPQRLTITATVVSPHPAANTASISHSDQFDPNPDNNSATTSTNPQQADLALAKTVSNATPNVGDTITFTVTLTNSGPNHATGVQVTDVLPTGLTLVHSSPSQGSYVSATGLWTVGSLANGAQATLTLTATVVSPDAQTNVATITGADQFDPDRDNNQASTTTTPQQADLALAKTVSDATPNVGDTITFTVTLSNHGPDPATGVTVHDLLPTGLTFVSATPSAGTYNSISGVWTVGTVATTAAQTLLIRATVVSPGPQSNTATISAADQFDPDNSNNTANVTATPQQADLALSKTVSDATPNVGDVITYTVTLTNHGPDTATGVTIDDLLPAGLGFVSATATVGSYSSVTGVWAVGTLDNGAGAVLTLDARVVSPAAQTNTATISHSDQFDPVPGNNTANVTATPQQADLALAKTVSDATPNVGDVITYTVTLSNHGPDPATNVTVEDLLPAGLTFVTATPSQGEYSSASGTWIVGTVTPGTPQTLQIQARVDSPAAQTNTVMISTADQFDPNTANNTASAIVTPQQADLALAKSVSNATPNVGDVITYTVTLTNHGPGAASGVTVSDPLPPGLSFVSFTASQGSYDSGTGLWTVGDVAAGVLQTLQIHAQVVSPSTQTNTAAISHSDQFDPNPGNNSASTTETPQQADLTLSKTVSDATPNVGDTITFIITLTNNGPDAATSVAVTDLLPGGLSFVAATPSLGT